jgi:SAM-dependent methyltransferase
MAWPTAKAHGTNPWNAAFVHVLPADRLYRNARCTTLGAKMLAMGLYRDLVLPVVTDVALGGRAFEQVRDRVTAGIAGDVLEVGFGSGRNIPHLPSAVERVLAVEPASSGRRLAAKRIAATSIPVDYVGLDGAALPLADESIDHVLTTWTLCTIPDVSGALAEIVRVLRPGGTFHFAEHGRSPDAAVARWQDRLTPYQRKVFGGCHLNRRIDQLVTDAGLELTEIRNYTMPGPRIFGYMFEGVATKRM